MNHARGFSAQALKVSNQYLWHQGVLRNKTPNISFVRAQTHSIAPSKEEQQNDRRRDQ